MRRLILFSLLFTNFLSSCKKEKKESPPSPPAAFDARYNVTGTMKDFSTTSFSGNYPHEITLIRNSETQGTMVPKDLGIPGHLISAGINASFYSNFGIIITIDPSTNKITAITNHYGQPSSNGRSATLDPSGANTWNPGTKEIKIKYWMDEPAAFTPHRVSFDETWTYLGPK